MTTLRTSRPSNTIATVYPFGASTPRVFHLVKSWINAHAMLKPPRLLSHLEARVWLQNILPRQCLLTSARYDSYGHEGAVDECQVSGKSKRNGIRVANAFINVQIALMSRMSPLSCGATPWRRTLAPFTCILKHKGPTDHVRPLVGATSWWR